jgi:hypothetical protein
MKRAMLRPALIASVGVLLVVIGCSSSSNGVPASGCSSATPCANGMGSMQACYTSDATGACASLYYQVGSATFNCVSCDDQGYCENAAMIACGVPGASIPADADLPEGATLFVDSGGGVDSEAGSVPSDAGSALDSGDSGDSGAAESGAADSSAADSGATDSGTGEATTD